jgi:sugar phosphate isomerase/epimerase
VRHIHVNDNFGLLGDAFDELADRNPYGEGDLHLPPGWGRIPLVDALAQLGDYQGALVLELRPRYRAHFAEALATMRTLIARVQEINGEATGQVNAGQSES